MNTSQMINILFLIGYVKKSCQWPGSDIHTFLELGITFGS